MLRALGKSILPWYGRAGPCWESHLPPLIFEGHWTVGCVGGSTMFSGDPFFRVWYRAAAHGLVLIFDPIARGPFEFGRIPEWYIILNAMIFCQQG